MGMVRILVILHTQTHIQLHQEKAVAETILYFGEKNQITLHPSHLYIPNRWELSKTGVLFLLCKNYSKNIKLSTWHFSHFHRLKFSVYEIFSVIKSSFLQNNCVFSKNHRMKWMGFQNVQRLETFVGSVLGFVMGVVWRKDTRIHDLVFKFLTVRKITEISTPSLDCTVREYNPKQIYRTTLSNGSRVNRV